MKRLASLRSVLLGILLIMSSEAQAQTFWSIGPKLGGTIGTDGGFTWGLEASYFPKQTTQVTSSFYQFTLFGFTADLTFWKEHTTLHLGVEKMYDVIGLDAGPTIFFQNGSVQEGLSLIPFWGALLFGYYELAWPFTQKPYQSVGGYIKIPVGIKIISKGSAF